MVDASYDELYALRLIVLREQPSITDICVANRSTIYELFLFMPVFVQKIFDSLLTDSELPHCHRVLCISGELWLDCTSKGQSYYTTQVG